MSARYFSKLSEDVVKEEGEPDAFATAFFSHQVHPVVPIAGAHQGQTVLAEFQSMFDRAHAMLVKRGIFLGAIWQIVIRFLFRHNRTGIEPRVRFQNSWTQDSATRLASARRKRKIRSCTSARLRPTPSRKLVSRSCSSARSKATCIAPHGSKPAPAFPESRARFSAAG